MEGYLKAVMLRTQRVDLAGIDPGAIDGPEAQPELSEIYVGLNTTRLVDNSVHWPDLSNTPGVAVSETSKSRAIEAFRHAEAADQPLTALRFVSACPFAALLGDPGSGKSTFANMLTLSLAAEYLGGDTLGLARLGTDWKHGAMIPVLVIIREFAAASHSFKSTAVQDRLWNFIVSKLPGTEREELGRLLKTHFVEQGGIFILDGYDEAPETDHHRQFVKTATQALREAFPRCRVLLTSRVYAYQRRNDREWRLEGFEEATLDVLTREQQNEFADRWYAECARKHPTMSAAEASGRAELFKTAIAERPDLSPLAERPLLLTLMASLHAWRHGSLPDDREGLYDKSVELLTQLWERPKEVIGEGGESLLIHSTLAAYLKTSPVKVSESLEHLAFDAHKNQERCVGEADIKQEALAGALYKVADPAVSLKDVIAYVVDRAGLLSDHGGIYRFPHRTFQEYMAARYLTREPEELPTLLCADTERWREAFLLMGSRTAARTPYAAWSLMHRVLEEAREATVDVRGLTASLCAQLLCEAKLLESTLKKSELRTLEEVISRLLDVLTHGHLSISERAAAGLWLGRIGDPRPGVGVKNGIPDIDWIIVDPRAAPGQAADWAASRGLELPFKIARYPVTVAQYEAYCSATGREAPELPAAFAGPTHPQVDVSWHDAETFCAWLSGKVNVSIDLPTEAQWEFMATGGEEREFPWGPWQAGRANTHEAKIERTSVVGLFPTGASPVGALDVAGQVWEWSKDLWGDESKIRDRALEPRASGDLPRVLRGGSWINIHEITRCATRHRNHPNYRNLNVGFRVCVSPFSHSGL